MPFAAISRKEDLDAEGGARLAQLAQRAELPPGQVTKGCFPEQRQSQALPVLPEHSMPCSCSSHLSSAYPDPSLTPPVPPAPLCWPFPTHPTHSLPVPSLPPLPVPVLSPHPTSAHGAFPLLRHSPELASSRAGTLWFPWQHTSITGWEGVMPMLLVLQLPSTAGPGHRDPISTTLEMGFGAQGALQGVRNRNEHRDPISSTLDMGFGAQGALQGCETRMFHPRVVPPAWAPWDGVMWPWCPCSVHGDTFLAGD